MITIYDIRDVDDFIYKKRKRFNKINTNIYIILSAFKKNEKNVSKKILKVLKLFFYYNKYMRKMNQFNALTIIYIN